MMFEEELHLTLPFALFLVYAVLWFLSDAEPAVPYPIQDNYYHVLEKGESVEGLLLFRQLSRSNLIVERKASSPLLDFNLLEPESPLTIMQNHGFEASDMTAEMKELKEVMEVKELKEVKEVKKDDLMKSIDLIDFDAPLNDVDNVDNGKF